MTAKQLSTRIGFDIESAKRAKLRQYQEAFSIIAAPEEKKTTFDKLRNILSEQGYDTTIGGGFYHIMKGGSKQKAVSLLSKILSVKYGTIRTMGLGDAQSDLDFLSICDVGYLLNNDTRIVPIAAVPAQVHVVDDGGPDTWNTLVLEFLSV